MALADAFAEQDGGRSDDWGDEGRVGWVEGRALSAIAIMDKMMKSEPGSSSFESYAASLARMLKLKQVDGKTGEVDASSHDALPIALILNSKTESTLTTGLQECLRRINSYRNNCLQVINGLSSRKATLQSRLISLGALESLLKLRTSTRIWTACPAAKELFHELSKTKVGAMTLCDLLENEVSTFILAEGARDQSNMLYVMAIFVRNGSSISGPADIRETLIDQHERASDLVRNALSVSAIFYSKQDHEACEKVISFVFMMLNPTRQTHNPHVRAATAMRIRNQQARNMAHDEAVNLDSECGREDPREDEPGAENLRHNIENDSPLRSSSCHEDADRQAVRWTELFANARRTVVQEVCQSVAGKQPGSWAPPDLPAKLVRVLLLQLADLDHYCDHQSELRHILWSLCMSCQRSSLTLSAEVKKLAQDLLGNADAYMTAIATLASQEGIAHIPADFDESIVYHLLTQMQIMRSWKLPQLPCVLSEQLLGQLLRILSKYLRSIQGCLSAEEFLIEDASQRRLIKSRHFTRAPYVVDCIRVAALQEVNGPPTASFCALQRRFLQTTVSPSFRVAIGPHVALLNALIQSMPSICDDAGPLSFMLVNSLDVDPDSGCPPESASTPSAAMKEKTKGALLLSDVPAPLTTFGTRHALFRHRAAIHLQFDLSDATERQDWITAESPGGIRVLCRRSQALRDSIATFKQMSQTPRRCRLFVRFEGEPAAGMGVTREWFQVIAAELFAPGHGFFRTSKCGNALELNSSSAGLSKMGDHLRVFRFAGQFLALALLHNVTINAPLSISFVKAVLGLAVVLEDLETEDPEMFGSLRWILEHPVEPLSLSFEHCVEYHGQVHSVPLRPGGHLEAVTDSNKAEYVQLLVHTRCTRAVRPQLRAMREGFNGILPRPVLEVLAVHDVLSMLVGQREIDVGDWEANTELVGWTRTDNVVRWFFGMLRRSSDARRSQTLRFAAALSRPPVGGFAALPSRFRLCKCDLPLPRLPVAHTCFAELILPVYKTEENLLEAFDTALAESANSFGLA